MSAGMMMGAQFDLHQERHERCRGSHICIREQPGRTTARTTTLATILGAELVVLLYQNNILQ
jgi:hypothetical protein